MSTTMPLPVRPADAAEETPAAPEPVGPVPPVLHDQLPVWMHVHPRVGVFTAFLCFLFWRFSVRPLWFSEVWTHLAYGDGIRRAGTLPATEPLLPLCTGMPYVDVGWLAQVILAACHAVGGVPAVQALAAGCLTLALGCVVTAVSRKTGSLVFPIAAAVVVLLNSWQQLFVGFPEMAIQVRPMLFGLAAFAWLFMRLVDNRPNVHDWWGIPLLAGFWANLHSSAVLACLLPAAFALGRALDLLRRTGRASRVWTDAAVRRGFLIAELAAAALFLNPYGLGLFQEAFAPAGRANLAALVEWQPLDVTQMQGMAAAATALALAIAYRWSPRRVESFEMILLVGLGFWSLWTTRMLVWWSIPAAYCLAVHTHAALARLRHYAEAPEPERRSLWAVLAVMSIWIASIGSNLGQQCLGRTVQARDAISRITPVGIAQHLRENPPQGLVFNTLEWGGYLLHHGPSPLALFAASEIQLLPGEVWRAYLQIHNASLGWDDALDRFGVTTVVVGRQQQALIGRLTDSADWKLAYEDRHGSVFVRVKPL